MTPSTPSPRLSRRPHAVAATRATNAAAAMIINTSYLLVVEAADAQLRELAALLFPVLFSSFQKVVASWYIQKLPLGQGVALQVQVR